MRSGIAENAAKARESRRQRRPDLVLLDIWMPDTDGISLLKEWSVGTSLDAPVIIMSGHGTVETAVEATRLGAYDFIEKPLSIAKILVTVQRALENASLRSENVGLRQRVLPDVDPIGESKIMQRLRDSAKRIADHKTSVLITGASGCGKEVMARYIHKHSRRRRRPVRQRQMSPAWLARTPTPNCSASSRKAMWFSAPLEIANGGTLFLKDIADMDLNTQARLLSALENQSFLRVGGRDLVSIDIRIIAGTSKNLIDCVAIGEFRDDFFYHLNVLPLAVPALSERTDDIDQLIEFFFASVRVSGRLVGPGIPSCRAQSIARL